MSVRRYLTIIQDPRGYPPTGAELDPAPPEGPAPPTLHQVVLADDFERVEAEAERLRALLADVEPFVGWQAEVSDLKRRVREALDADAAKGDEQ